MTIPDPVLARQFLLQVITFVFSGYAIGVAPTILRGTARRGDPSLMAAMLLTVYAGLAAFDARRDGVLTPLTTGDLPAMIGLAVLTTLLALTLITALSGGLVSKVMPVVYGAAIPLLLIGSFSGGTVLGTFQLSAVALILLGIMMIESRTKSLRGQYWFFYAVGAMVLVSATEWLRGAFFVTAPPAWLRFWQTAPAAVLAWLFALIGGKLRRFPSMPGRAYWSVPLAAVLFFAASYLRARIGTTYTFRGVIVPVSTVGLFCTLVTGRIHRHEKQPGSALFGMFLIIGALMIIANGL